MSDFDKVSQTIEAELKKRFLAPGNFLYDYAGLDGTVLLPTPDECLANKPNPMGWWTPIENGAFFTGDYLLGLIRNSRRICNRQREDWCRTLLQGLFALQDAAAVDGCIVRGLGSDGQCHYPASSNDQILPWILAIYEYQRQNYASVSEKADCHSRLLRLLSALKQNHWVIPGDKPGYERGSFLNENNLLEARLSVVHIAIATAILAELTDVNDDWNYHSEIMKSHLLLGKTRLQLLSEGFVDIPLSAGWYTAHSVYALRLLNEISRDDNIKQAAVEGRLASARNFLPAITEWKKYQPGTHFSPDWRVCLSRWSPHSSCSEGEKIAYQEISLWAEKSPQIEVEKKSLRHAFAAAWIALLGGDSSITNTVHHKLESVLESIPCQSLYDASFYLLENIISEWDNF